MVVKRTRWVLGVERADAKLCLFEQVRASAHQPQPGLIPGDGLVHGQPPPLEMLHDQLERGERLLKRPLLNQGPDAVQRGRTVLDAIHHETTTRGARGRVVSTLDWSAPSAKRA